jgi:hypothetical protein
LGKLLNFIFLLKIFLNWTSRGGGVGEGCQKGEHRIKDPDPQKCFIHNHQTSDFLNQPQKDTSPKATGLKELLGTLPAGNFFQQEHSDAHLLPRSLYADKHGRRYCRVADFSA